MTKLFEVQQITNRLRLFLQRFDVLFAVDPIDQSIVPIAHAGALISWVDVGPDVERGDDQFRAILKSVCEMSNENKQNTSNLY